MKDLFRQVVNEIIDEDSKVAQAAKAKGLEYMKFGRWGKNGKVTHISKDGQLVQTGVPGAQVGSGGREPTEKEKSFGAFGPQQTTASRIASLKRMAMLAPSEKDRAYANQELEKYRLARQKKKPSAAKQTQPETPKK